MLSTLGEVVVMVLALGPFSAGARLRGTTTPGGAAVPRTLATHRAQVSDSSYLRSWRRTCSVDGLGSLRIRRGETS